MTFFSKLKEGLEGVKKRWSAGITSLFVEEPFDENFWNELEEKLIAGDVGITLSESLVTDLKDEAKKNSLSSKAELKKFFIEMISDRLSAVDGMGKPFEADGAEGPPALVLLMAGVNGSGKTTSAGKLAMQFLNQGKKVVLAAADTFRAAASEQLQVWGDRAGVRVISQSPGSDPAAVAFDAWQAARASSSDVLIVDTAGRLQAKHNLMEELRKIYRILEREAGAERLKTVLVLDAVTGQNGIAQADAFNRIFPLSAVILSKYDNTAKGGVVLSIACDLKIPIRYIGLGEKIEDLSPFDPADFAAALMGGEQE